MWPPKYDIYVADYSLIIRKNKVRPLIFGLLFWYVILFVIVVFYLLPNHVDKIIVFGFAFLTGIVIVYAQYREYVSDNLIVKVDSKTGEIMVGNSEELLMEDVILIEVNCTKNRSGYLTHYVDLVLSDNGKKRIEDIGLYFGRAEKEMVYALADFMKKEIKRSGD